MLRENEISVSPVRINESGYGSGSGAPVIAPTFIAPTTAPSLSPYSMAAPVAPVAPVGGLGYGSGGLLESVVLLSLLGNRGLGGYGLGGGDTVAATVTAQSVSDLRADVGQLAKDVVGVNTTVHAVGNETQAAFALAATNQAAEFRNLDNQICDVEKEAIKAQYESKIATLQSTNEITNKIDLSTVDIKNQLYNMSTTMASEFCDTKHLIEKGNADLALQAERNYNGLTLQLERGFCKIAEDALRAEIADLRDQRECNRRQTDLINTGNLLANQTNSILNTIDSQLQRQTSQIVQFGTGNSATPTNTNTQTTVS